MSSPAPSDYQHMLSTPSAQLVEQVRAGLPFQALHALREHLGMSVREVAGLVQIPERTLARRRGRRGQGLCDGPVPRWPLAGGGGVDEG